MKSKNIITFILVIMLISSVSALKFDNIKDYDPEKEEITIKNAFGLGEELARYTLIENSDTCFIDCYAIGEVELFNGEYLFEEIVFKNKKDKNKNLPYKIFYAKKGEKYKLYDGEILKPGIYDWKIEAKKNPQESIDWVVTAIGKDLSEWAWWDNNWDFKKQVNITGGSSSLSNFPTYIIGEVNGNMQSDLDDIRFVNASETGELYYDIELINSTNFGIWVNLPTLDTGVNTIYMYYGNGGASKGENESAVYQYNNELSIWNFENFTSSTDSKSSNGINNLSSITKIDNEGAFGYASNHTTTQGTSSGTFLNGKSQIAVEFWVKRPWTEATNFNKYWGDSNSDISTGFVIQNSGNTIQVYGQGGGTTVNTGDTINDGNWHHFVWTKNATTSALYLDGVRKNQDSSSSGTFGAGTVYFGQFAAGAPISNVSLDNFVIYDSGSQTEDYIEMRYQNINQTRVTFSGEISSGNLATINSITYNSTTTDLINQSFVLNVTLDATVTSSSAIFYYNGTGYLSKTTTDGTNTLYTNILNIPATYGTKTKGFFWQLSLVNASGTFNQNSTSNDQQVTGTQFALCNATLTNKVANFSIYDESDLTTPVNVSTFDATFSWFITQGGSTKNISVSLGSDNHFSFCSNPDANYTVSSDIFLEANGYVDRTVNLLNQAYNNTFPLIPLYLVNSSLGTNVIIEVKDQGLSPIRGYNVEIFRYFESTNSYVQISSRTTDYFGQFVERLIENDVKYKFKFYDESGTLVKETTDVIIACRATICVLPFVIEDTTEYFGRFDNLTDYEYTLQWNNNTNTFTFSWNDNRGQSPTHRLQVTKYLFNGTTVVYNASSTSLSSSLSYGVGNDKASYTAQAFRTVSGEQRRIAQLSATVGSGANTFGLEGVMWSMILLGTCIAIGVFSPPIGIVLFGVGFIFLGIANIIFINPAISIAVMAICIAFAWAFRG